MSCKLEPFLNRQNLGKFLLFSLAFFRTNLCTLLGFGIRVLVRMRCGIGRIQQSS